jgi:hypothetical protein
MEFSKTSKSKVYIWVRCGVSGQRKGTNPRLEKGFAKVYSLQICFIAIIGVISSKED